MMDNWFLGLRAIAWEWRENMLARIVFYVLVVPLLLLCTVKQCFATGPLLNDVSYKVISDVAVSRGFSAADPRILRTAANIGTEIGKTATSEAALVAVGRKIPWGAALSRSALGLAVQIGIGAAISLFSDSNGNVVSSLSNDSSTGAMTQGGSYAEIDASTYNLSCQASSASGLLQVCAEVAKGVDIAKGRPSNSIQSATCSWSSLNVSMTCSVTYWVSSSNHGNDSIALPMVKTYTSGAPASCGTGLALNKTCHTPGPLTTTFGNTIDPFANLPTSVQSQPVDPDLIAKAIDNWWRKAAQQPGYDGIPYDFYRPVTINDVKITKNNPTIIWPTIIDLVTPVTPTAVSGTPVSTVPVPQNTDQSGPLTTTQPAITGTGAPLNLGLDPVVGSPALESTPTAAQILGPLFNIMPGIKNFVVPSHQSACPTYTFHFGLGSWWSQDVTMSSHCALVESNRAAITAAMLVVFSLAALFIVLTA